MKKCCMCKEIKPLNEYYNKKSSPDGKQNVCIDCYKKPPKNKIIVDSKICSKCKKKLPIESFNKRRSHPDGHQSTCKECIKLFPSAIKRREAAKTHRKPYVRHVDANKAREVPNVRENKSQKEQGSYAFGMTFDERREAYGLPPLSEIIKKKHQLLL